MTYFIQVIPTCVKVAERASRHGAGIDELGLIGPTGGRMHRLFGTLILGLLVGAVGFAQAPRDTYVALQFGAIVTLDPARAFDTASSHILENVYETLITFDDPAIDRLQPLLATDYQVLDGGLTYRFTLRPNVRFHSGNTMSCEDVAWSIKYGLVAAAPEGPVTYLLSRQFLGTQQAGDDVDAFLAAVTWDMIDRTVTCPDGPDGLVAELHILEPDPPFLNILAHSGASVIDSRWAIENGVWDGTESTWQDWIGRDLTGEFLHRNVSGTGAYRVVDWDGISLIASRFGDYWGDAPALANVVVNTVPEEATRILALQQGDADRIEMPQRASLVQVRGMPGVTVHERPDWINISTAAGFFNFDIDTTDNVDVGSGRLDGRGIPADFFADVNVRRGFAHLFDPDEFVAQIYQGSGTPLTMGLPSSFMGYNDDVPIRGLDLEEAERYLRMAWDGAVWETGFEFTALYNAGNAAREAFLNIIKENLEFLNPRFRMNVRSLPWPDYLARTAERKAPLFALGWLADYADSRNYINTFYDNDGFYAPRTGIDFPEIQALIDEADVTLDPEARAFLYRSIGTLHHDLVPLIVLPSQWAFLVTRDDLTGVYYNPIRSHNFLWKDIAKN
jgi:peptide/nickel transport system substrate-binding protein